VKEFLSLLDVTFSFYADLMTKIFGVTIDDKDAGGERSDTHQEGQSEEHTF